MNWGTLIGAAFIPALAGTFFLAAHYPHLLGWAVLAVMSALSAALGTLIGKK